MKFISLLFTLMQIHSVYSTCSINTAGFRADFCELQSVARSVDYNAELMRNNTEHLQKLHSETEGLIELEKRAMKVQTDFENLITASNTEVTNLKARIEKLKENVKRLTTKTIECTACYRS